METTATADATSRRSRTLRVAVRLAPLCLCALLFGCRGGAETEDAYTARVKRGDLEIEVRGRGEMLAEFSRKIVVPRFSWGSWRSQMKVVKLIPEGTQVKVGDFLASLDTVEMVKEQRDAEAELKKSQADWEKSRKTYEIQKSKLEVRVSRLRSELEIKQLSLGYSEALPRPVAAVEAQVNLEKAEKFERYAQAEYDPIRELAAEGYESQASLDSKKLERDLASVGHRLQRSQYDLVMSGSDPYDLARAKLAVERAGAELAKAEAEFDLKSRQYELGVEEARFLLDKSAFDLKRTSESIALAVFHAPTSGVVTYARVFQGRGLEKVKEGVSVRAHYELVRIEDTSTMIADVEIEESQISQVRVGMPAQVLVDAIPGETFAGVVIEIESIARQRGEGKAGGMFEAKKEQTGIRVFHVKVRLEGTDGRVRPGFNGDVHVIVETIAGALSVPRDAIFKKSGRTIAYVWEGGAARETEVVTGKVAGDRIVVTQGLSEDERVRVTEPEA